MIASDVLEVSGGGDYYWESDSLYLFNRSLAVVEVAVLEVVVVNVASTSVAVIEVATTLEVVDIKVASFLVW